MLANQGHVVAGLVGVEEVVAEGVDHLQRAVPEAGLGVPRVDQQSAHLDQAARVRGVEPGVPGELSVDEQVPAQVGLDGRGLRPQARDQCVLTTHGLQAVGEGAQRLVVQRDRPRAAHRDRHRRVGGLERVVPVAVAVGDQAGPREQLGACPGERGLEVGAHRRGRGGRGAGRGVPGHLLLEQRVVTGRLEVPAEGEDRPVDDVAVRWLHPEVLVAREEAEGLGPGAVGVLGREDAHQQGACVGLPVQGEQQLERALRHVPGAPRAAGVLLETAR